MKLKPCPFCGSTAALCLIDSKEFDNEHGIDWMEYKEDELQYQIICDANRYSKPHKNGCGAASGWGNNKKQAVEAWNRRAGE